MEAAADWRTHVQPDSRRRIVTKILETLERQVPISGPEVLVELNKVAVRLEDTIFTIATSQTDYLRKISLKMLAMETKSQTNEVANSLLLNTGGTSQNPQEPASYRMQSQASNPGQPQIPLENQYEARQQLLTQNIPNNIGNSGIHEPVELSFALPSGASLTQSSMPNAVNPGSNIQSGVAQNSSGNLVGQGGVASNMLATSTRQLQGWQLPQQTGSQLQQSQNSQQFWYQQQQSPLQQLQGNISSSIMQSHMQQLQQNPMQLTQLQSTQQPRMQMSFGLHPSLSTLQQTHPSVMQSSSGLQQNPQSDAAQSTVNVLQHHPQSVIRQPHQQFQQSMHQQAPVLHQQQQRVLPSQQHAQQKKNAPNLQQHQLIGQQNNVSNMQQQQQKQQGPLNQQNNVANMAQHLLGNNICLQQQLGQQSNMSGLQKQQQQPIYIMHQQGGKAQQQLYAQVPTNMLQIQGQHAQCHPAQQQLMSQHPSQIMQTHQQPGLRHQPNSLQRDIQQRIQTSGGSMLNHQSLLDQKQVFHSQRPPPEASSKWQTSIVAAVTGNTAATGYAVDVQEEVYQTIKSMREKYLPYLCHMHQKISQRCQQHDSLPQPPKSEQIERLKIFKNILDKMMGFLNLPKSSVIPSLKDKLASYEKQILNILNSIRSWNPGLLQHQIQPTGDHAVSIQQQQQQQQQQQHQQLQQQQDQLPLSTSIDAAITGNATATGNAVDQQEEVYQTIKSMGEKYLPDLSYMHQSISQKCQVLSVASPQLSQHSPQIGQKSLLSSLTKTGTPLQSANSPFIVPSPSAPLAPSPIHGNPEKQTSGVSSLSNSGNIGEVHSTASRGQVQSLAIDTPGILASPLLAELTGPDGNQVTSSTITKPSATEQPLECLLKEVKFMSPKAFSASASDFGSVISMIDMIAGSAPGIGSQASVGEDLVTVTESHIQARNFIQQDGSLATKIMKRQTTAVPLNAMSSAGSMSDSFKQLVTTDFSDAESTATSRMKRPRVEV